jgi:hypothetical protein
VAVVVSVVVLMQLAVPVVGEEGLQPVPLIPVGVTVLQPLTRLATFRLPRPEA